MNAEHTQSTIHRIQKVIEGILPSFPKGINKQSLKDAVKNGHGEIPIRPEHKENWDAQFDLAITGLLIRQRIKRIDQQFYAVPFSEAQALMDELLGREDRSEI